MGIINQILNWGAPPCSNLPKKLPKSGKSLEFYGKYVKNIIELPSWKYFAIFLGILMLGLQHIYIYINTIRTIIC